MKAIRGMACLGLFALCPLAQGAIAFSFADPGPGHQLTNTADGGGAGIGLLSYSSTQAITFNIDGTTEEVGNTTFTNARFEMSNMTLGAPVFQGGILVAPVAGSFAFYDFTDNVRTDILTATVPTGSFVRIGNASALLFSSSQGLVYTAGPALQAMLGASGGLGNPQEAVFTLTDIVAADGGPIIDANGAFTSFSANSSFSGNTATVPAPSSVALLYIAAGLVAKRRRN